MMLRLLMLALCLGVPELRAQQVAVADAPAKSAAVASFVFDWPEAPIPHWSIQLSEGPNGTLVGRYDRFAVDGKPSAETMRPITVTKATAERLRAPFKTVAGGNCETKIKHLAQTGSKNLSYAKPGSDAWVGCTFNYSDDKALMSAVDAFAAIAETVQAGEKLEHAHRFDRLGLDAQLESLTSQVKQGNAIEVQNIAAVLRSIVEDERVIDRARRQAARLLQDAAPSTEAADAPSPR